MGLGDIDIYSKTFEELVRDVRRSGLVDQNWEPSSADVKFEYKWDVRETDDSQTFGPFSEEEMQSWFKASYFGPSGEKVKIRPVGGEWVGWSDIFEWTYTLVSLDRCMYYKHWVSIQCSSMVLVPYKTLASGRIQYLSNG